jgi:hypothetical protein
LHSRTSSTITGCSQGVLRRRAFRARLQGPGRLWDGLLERRRTEVAARPSAHATVGEKRTDMRLSDNAIQVCIDEAEAVLQQGASASPAHVGMAVPEHAPLPGRAREEGGGERAPSLGGFRSRDSGRPAGRWRTVGGRQYPGRQRRRKTTLVCWKDRSEARGSPPPERHRSGLLGKPTASPRDKFR